MPRLRLLLHPREFIRALTWRRVGKALFYAPTVLIGIPGILLLPFFLPSIFRFAQLALFVSFVVAVKYDFGIGRHGDAFERHNGFRLVLDHLMMIFIVAMGFTMALSAPGGFRYAWWFCAPGLLFVYWTLASGQSRRHRERHERYQRRRALVAKQPEQ